MTYSETAVMDLRNVVADCMKDLAEVYGADIDNEEVEFVTQFLIRFNNWNPDKEDIAQIFNDYNEGIYFYTAGTPYELGRNYIETGVDYPGGIEEEDHQAVGEWLMEDYEDNYMETEYGIYVVGEF